MHGSSLSLDPRSKIAEQLQEKRAEYRNRIDRGFHSHDPFMLACEHAKILILTWLFNAQGQPVQYDDLVQYLAAVPEQAAHCRYIDEESNIDSFDEAWSVIDRYINHGGQGLAGGTGLHKSR